MMRTVEVMLVIIIIFGAFVLASFFAVLPSPREVSPLNLRRLALSTLEVLDSDYSLSEIAFVNRNDTDFAEVVSRLRVALSACLPPNIIYNLTVYQVLGGGGSELYAYCWSVSNAESLGVGSDAASLLVASSNVTFNVIPEKVGEKTGIGGTLYILNCSDARGWWITGYSAHSLAQDLYNLLSPYFQKTVMVQNTAQLGLILNNQSLQGETVQNAVVINTFGEAVPIPSAYCTTPYSNDYARYFHFLGNMTRLYNWTWVSIVGYPFYYVSNTESLNNQNGWGIWGMNQTGPAGMNAFLQGIDNRNYSRNTAGVVYTGDVIVTLSPQVLDCCNYYGIYPYPIQTSKRALSNSTLASYNLFPKLYIFNSFSVQNQWYNPGALYHHIRGTRVEGSLLALGVTRTPDIRLTAIGLLSYYKPRLYCSEYTATNATRLVVLQLGVVGGV
ncbi:MAG: hypothetical protein QXI91_02755 [Candidatus Bathyarchaeia archaeon]